MDCEFSLPLEAIEEKTVSSQKIFDGVVLHVLLDEILLPNGKIGTREYCHHNGAVCVIPITENDEVICVRQYRYPMHEPLLEIPAGKLDTPDEDHAEAAMRELREETGAVYTRRSSQKEPHGRELPRRSRRLRKALLPRGRAGEYSRQN